jgi:ABC-type uncharacterized transport system YnjBCD permease subunit
MRAPARNPTDLDLIRIYILFKRARNLHSDCVDLIVPLLLSFICTILGKYRNMIKTGNYLIEMVTRTGLTILSWNALLSVIYWKNVCLSVPFQQYDSKLIQFPSSLSFSRIVKPVRVTISQ